LQTKIDFDFNLGYYRKPTADTLLPLCMVYVAGHLAHI
jgi:hypothetical protein